MDLEQNASSVDEAIEVGADSIAEAGATEIAAEPEPVTVEGLAGEMGWRPKEEWKGDLDKWKPAHEYMRATVDVNRKLGNRLKGVEDQLARVARTSVSITEREVAKERDRLLQERKDAFDAGDYETFERADQELKVVAAKAPEPIIPDETHSFIERNASWFQKDQEATAWAINRTNELAATGLGHARQLAIVEREAKAMFPEFFEAEKSKPKAAPLNAPGSRSASPARKGFASLPADAQKAALDFEAKRGINREEYAKIYYEEN